MKVLTQFALDVIEGFSSSPKAISSKYFYDKEGSLLFQKIMDLDEYYPTRTEREILETHGGNMADIFRAAGPFDLVDLGAGDGAKTRILLEALRSHKADFRYCPIDISPTALEDLAASCENDFPGINVKTIHGEYFQCIASLPADRRKVIMFLGSSIGNFSDQLHRDFFGQLKNLMNPEDLLMIGFDLKKLPSVVRAAYNDKKGVTRDFNLNLLKRMNNELGANFNLDQFLHYPIYNPENGKALSYLVSKVEQEVYFEELDRSFSFDAWESIHTETSRKYSLKDIHAYATQFDFETVADFSDKNTYFVNTIWRA